MEYERDLKFALKERTNRKGPRGKTYNEMGGLALKCLKKRKEKKTETIRRPTVPLQAIVNMVKQKPLHSLLVWSSVQHFGYPFPRDNHNTQRTTSSNALVVQQRTKYL